MFRYGIHDAVFAALAQSQGIAAIHIFYTVTCRNSVFDRFAPKPCMTLWIGKSCNRLERCVCGHKFWILAEFSTKTLRIHKKL
jgi:hypothetical protein